MPQAIALPNWHQNEPGTKKAFLLSLLVHALLIIMLTVHINWKTSSSPAGVEVELWDNTPPPPPPPEPVIIEKTLLPVQEKADIVVEKKKEEPKKEVKLEKKVEPKVITPPPKAIEKPKVEPPKIKPKPIEEAPKLKVPVKEPPKEKPKTVAESPKDPKQIAIEEKERADRIERLRAQAGIESGSGGIVGQGIGGGGNASPGYAERVNRFIKSKIIFNPAQVVGNPLLIISIEVAPDGRIINKRITKASGEPDWDNAVIRALDLASPLPKDDKGVIPSKEFLLKFKPKD
jgi:colicin import membrane protein